MYMYNARMRSRCFAHNVIYTHKLTAEAASCESKLTNPNPLEAPS